MGPRPKAASLAALRSRALADGAGRANRHSATTPTTAMASSIVAARAAEGDRCGCCQQHQISSSQRVDATHATGAGPHHRGARSESETVIEALGEDGMALGHERGQGGGEERQAMVSAGDLRRQQEREHHPDRREGDVGEAHQDQSAVERSRRSTDPDQRRHCDVVQRRMVGDPHPAVADVVGSRPLGLPLARFEWDLGERTDLGQASRGDLLCVADVRRLVRREERRLLQGVQGPDAHERDDDRDEADDDRHRDSLRVDGCDVAARGGFRQRHAGKLPRAGPGYSARFRPSSSVHESPPAASSPAPTIVPTWPASTQARSFSHA